MKRVLILVLALLFIAAGFGFAQKKVTFAYMPGIEDPFMRMIEQGAAAKAKELGASLIVGEYPKAWGADIQVPILEALVARGGFDFLIVVPTSNEALIAPLKKISAKGIPMVTTDTFLGNGDYSKASNFSFPLAYIGTDNVLGGYEVGKRLAELIGNTGKVYMNTTNPDASSVTGRRDGFLKAMKEFPEIQVVGIDYNLDVQETAQRQTSAVLQKHPDLKGIFGTNLFSAQGAYQAVDNAGLSGEVKIASWDATPDLIQALKDGKVDLVLAQRPYQIGQLAVEWGYKYLTQKAAVPKKVIPGFFFFTRENVDAPGSQSYIYK
jgi:ribose transport system substrate-binding protein